MAIAFDAASGHASSGTSTLGITVGSGSDRVLLASVGVRGNDSGAITGANYNSVSMLEIAEVTSGTTTADRMFWWFLLVNPDSGSNTITAEGSGLTGIRTMTAISFSGVDQIDVLGSVVQNDDTIGTSTNNNVGSTNVGDLIVDIVYIRNGSAGTTSFAADGAQTVRLTTTDDASTGSHNVKISTKPRTGSLTNMAWSWANSDPWAYAGVALWPSAGGSVGHPAFSRFAGIPFAAGSTPRIQHGWR